MRQNNTQIKTQIFRKWENFSGWCKNYLIAKYLYYAVYACAYWNNKKNPVPLGKAMIKVSFHLLDDAKLCD